MPLASLLLSLVPPSPPAQSAPTLADVVWCDTTGDQLVRFSDLDGDGRYLSYGEAIAFHADPGSSPRDLQMRIEGGQPVVYWVDTVRDVVYRGRDLDGDGRIEGPEAVRFRDSAALDGSSGPDGLELTEDGAVWWTSDCCSHRGLFRLRDENGDGDANDPAEQAVLVDGKTAHLAGTDAGAVAFDAGALGRMAAAGAGVVAYVGGADQALFRFEDLDQDGDLDGPGESILFLDAAGKNPALPQNPDFAGGLLPSLQVAASLTSSSEPQFARLSYLTSMIEGGEEVFYLATQEAASEPASTNVHGKGLNGLFFRARDANGDRDVNDAGEVTLFYDGSKTSSPTTAKVGGVLGLDAVGDALYVADVASGAKQIHRMRDADGDGRLDPDELEAALFDLSEWGAQEPFPQQHAWVVELGVIAGGLWAPATFGVEGQGCASFGGVPQISGEGLAKLGTGELTCRVSGVPPFVEAYLWVGTSQSHWLGAPLPLDLGLLGHPGCTLYQNLVLSFAALTDAGGEAEVSLAIPADPVLLGFEIPMQWLVVHPQTHASALSALGLATIVE